MEKKVVNDESPVNTRAIYIIIISIFIFLAASLLFVYYILKGYASNEIFHKIDNSAQSYQLQKQQEQNKSLWNEEEYQKIIPQK